MANIKPRSDKKNSFPGKFRFITLLHKTITLIFKEDDDYDEYDGSTKPKMIPKNRSGPGSYNLNLLK